MTFLQQERDTDFFENYNHSGKRVVAKALSDKEGPSSIWSWRTTPMCDSQIAVAIEVRQSGAASRTVLAVWPSCWYFPHSTRGRHIQAVVGLLRWRSSEELLTRVYDFHLRGTISMVTKWRIVWFQTEKEKVRKHNHNTRTKFERKIRATFSTDSLSSPTSISSSFFLASLRTLIHGHQQERESCCCVDRRPFRREKRWERCGTRRGIVSCDFCSCGGTLTKGSAQKIVFQADHEDVDKAKKRKRRSSGIKIPTHLFVVVSPSNFRRVVGFPPTVNQHKPR